MSLKTIADSMKRRAHAAHGVEIVERLSPEKPPAERVKVKLKYEVDPTMPYEFRLQIQRVGNLPDEGTEARRKWNLELATFARYFGVPSTLEWTMQPGETTYAAFIRWFDEEAIAADYEKWLYTISQTLHVPAPRVEIDENDPIARAVGIMPPPIVIQSVRGESR